MSRKRDYPPLNVFLNFRPVGQLNRESSGAISFEYDESWLNWEHQMPISRSLPLRADRFTGASVMAVFDNLLPDNASIRQIVAERTGAAGIDAYSLLAEIGRDCVGALQFLPDGIDQRPLGEITGIAQSDAQIAHLLRNLKSAPLGIQRDEGFRISVAGAQEKTSLLHHNGEWLKPTGTTPSTHILKPQIGSWLGSVDLSQSVENEYLCLELIRAFGIPTANAEILEFEDQKVLSVERFDRHWTRDNRLIRLPQEDLCQALSIPPTQKYQNEGGPNIVQIMKTLLGSDNATQDRKLFFKANFLFWLMGATDGHGKNFSLSLLPHGRFELSPIYDVLTLQAGFDAKQITKREFKLAMSWGKSNHYKVTNITRRHIIETGLASGLSRGAIKDIIDETHASADAAIEKAAQNLPSGFPEAILSSVTNAIHSRLRTCALDET